MVGQSERRRRWSISGCGVRGAYLVMRAEAEAAEVAAAAVVVAAVVAVVRERV